MSETYICINMYYVLYIHIQSQDSVHNVHMHTTYICTVCTVAVQTEDGEKCPHSMYKYDTNKDKCKQTYVDKQWYILGDISDIIGSNKTNQSPYNELRTYVLV